MKKQFLIGGIICLLSLVCVSALLIEQYGAFQKDVTVTHPISTEGNLVQDISLMSGQGMFGEKFTITNIADWDIEVQIVSDNIEDEISVRYCYSENPIGFPLDCLDMMSNDVTLTLNNESIDIYPNYFANPLLASGTYVITTEVNPLA